MNKQGYTLIEVLAVITIIGIIATTATIAYNHYLTSSKESAYNALANSAYEATENYISEKDKKEDNTYTFSELKSDGYLESTKDPDKNESSCDGKVTYSDEEATVFLYCSKSTLRYIYNNGKLVEHNNKIEYTQIVRANKTINLENISNKSTVYVARGYSHLNTRTGDYSLSQVRTMTKENLYNRIKSGEIWYMADKEEVLSSNKIYKISEIIEENNYDLYKADEYTSKLSKVE